MSLKDENNPSPPTEVNSLSSDGNRVSHNPSGHIILRTLMQKTVFKIYPNGVIYVDKTQSSAWFTDSREVYKPKPKKKPTPMKKAQISKREEY